LITVVELLRAAGVDVLDAQAAIMAGATRP
jgi:hypothetical protein